MLQRRDAALMLVLVSMLIAVMLLAGKMPPKFAAVGFAAALVILGVWSGGFRHKTRAKTL